VCRAKGRNGKSDTRLTGWLAIYPFRVCANHRFTGGFDLRAMRRAKESVWGGRRPRSARRADRTRVGKLALQAAFYKFY